MKWYYVPVKTHFCIGLKLERLKRKKKCCILLMREKKRKHFIATKKIDESDKAYHHCKYNSVILHMGHCIQSPLSFKDS